MYGFFLCLLAIMLDSFEVVVKDVVDVVEGVRSRERGSLYTYCTYIHNIITAFQRQLRLFVGWDCVYVSAARCSSSAFGSD